ncbi:Flp family type IVb pilin [Thalassoglobus polymorphus]|uniref:Class III signal peptide n=1 Tax=Thalassoglobus polymorphus TaxID=2527994 RepID=A0A517QUT4_9PLAN|nr:class III signal peptide-containing protein [Thalassoglobus polymorphus]QDT35402.1 Class III signal peptide [Thalassoglobus polymorphus]
MSLAKKIRRSLNNKRGQGLVEYGILIGGVALVCLAAVSILGHKCNDLCATVAAALPCAHDDDIGPIVSGKLVNTTQDTNGVVYLDATTPGSIEDNMGIPGVASLVVEAADLAP